MTITKVGMYRNWLEPIPYDQNGNPVPKERWPKLRKHNWIVRWTRTNDKKYGKVFKTKKEADRYSIEMQGKVCQGKADKPNLISLHDFRLEHEKVMLGQVSLATYQEHNALLKLFENYIGGSVKLDKITPRHAEGFISELLAEKRIKIATINKYIRYLRSIFNRAIDPRGYLQEGSNPFKKIKPRKITPPPKRYVEISEYCKLIGATDDLWWKALISLAYSSGLRLNEMLNLTFNNIDFENRRINVEAKKGKGKIIEWEPKNRQNRVVPFS
ncbi:MAG: site-specific integrase [Desulfobacterales bacterium]|nr:site-specific integrase [Desulfobacterales bacterium]